MAGQPVKRGTMAHDHDAYVLLTDVAAQQGDAAAVRKYAPRAEELAERDGHRLYVAVVHRARGVAHRLAGEHAEAAARFERAMALFAALGTRWQMGRTLREMAELDLSRSDRTAARDHLARAIAEFEAMKAVPDATRARQALDALG